MQWAHLMQATWVHSPSLTRQPKSTAGETHSTTTSSAMNATTTIP
jgi:hypothetical protein